MVAPENGPSRERKMNQLATIPGRPTALQNDADATGDLRQVATRVWTPCGATPAGHSNRCTRALMR